MLPIIAMLSIAKAETISAKDLPRPSKAQLKWQNDAFGMFIHFAPNTWQDQEYDQLTTPLSSMDPTKLNTDQWARVAKEMGAKYIVFVAKHVGGFCWWQTNTTNYSVKNIPWEHGHGDVMADLSKSCKKYHLKLGIYLSPADHKHGVEVGGVASNPSYQPTYIKMYREQLKELLTRYGPIFEVWFDGSLKFDVGDILKKYAPHAVVFQGPEATIRWVGNEEGNAPYPCWNGAVYNPKTWGVLTAADGNPNGNRWLPNETDTKMRDTWFWNSHNANTIKSVSHLMNIYDNSIGHGTNLLLDLTPDPTGAIPAADAKRAQQFGREIHKEYGSPIVYSSGHGNSVEVGPSSPTTINTVITMEDISKGERIRKYDIEGLVNGNWKILCKGTAIGHEKIDHFDPVAVSDVRIKILDSVGVPNVRKIALYNDLRQGEVWSN